MTQCEMVIAYLTENEEITTLDAYRQLGITRLSARIHDLREQGWEFETRVKKVKDRYGNKAWVTAYRIDKEKSFLNALPPENVRE